MNTMWIMRGLPGSGKSRKAKAILEADSTGNTVICSSDSFAGLYTFDPNTKQVIGFDASKLGPAHGACLRNVVQAIHEGMDVVVDNTNISASEMAPYVALAQAYGYAPRIVTVGCDAETAWRRNTHNVPAQIHQRMYGEMLRYEALPHWRFIPGYTEEIA